MNKFEILFKLSDTADRLESAGLLREAIVLTNVMKRMAQDDNESEYQIAINKIVNLLNEGLKEKGFDKVASKINGVYNNYIAQLNTQIDQTRDNNKRAKLEKRKLNFYYQLVRLQQDYRSRLKVVNKELDLGVLSSESVRAAINNFGLEKARNLNDFNAKWQMFMNVYKNIHANGDPTLPKVYEVPGMQQYLANLYEQLKLKYIK